MAKADAKLAKNTDRKVKKNTAKYNNKKGTKAIVNPVPISSKEILEKAKVKPIKASKKNTKKAKASSSDSSSSSEDDKPKASQVKAPSLKPGVSSGSDDDDSESDEMTNPTSKSAPISIEKASSSNAKPNKMSSADSSDGDSESESDSEASTVAVKAKKTIALKTSPTKRPSLSEDSESDDGSSIVAPTVTGMADGDSDDDSDESSSDTSDESDDGSEEEAEDVEMADAPTNGSGKRKAQEVPVVPLKKVKLANGDAAPIDDQESHSVFVGKLSWNVDTDWLKQEFSDCGEVVSASVQMDRNTGKSRGFGYVHFTSADAVQKALAKTGQEIDGRAINVDVSTAPNKAVARENRAKTFGDKQSPPSTTLFIGNLAFSVVEDTLWNFFSEFGDVKSIRLPQDRDTGNMKGFGYVEFSDIESSKKAYDGSQGQDIEGRTIRIDYSQPREPGGGGRGGERGGFGGGRGRGGDRGGRGGGRGGFSDRGGRGGRGFGDRGRGGGRGGPRGGRGSARTGGIASFEGKKKTF